MHHLSVKIYPSINGHVFSLLKYFIQTADLCRTFIYLYQYKYFYQPDYNYLNILNVT